MELTNHWRSQELSRSRHPAYIRLRIGNGKSCCEISAVTFHSRECSSARLSWYEKSSLNSSLALGHSLTVMTKKQINCQANGNRSALLIRRNLVKSNVIKMLISFLPLTRSISSHTRPISCVSFFLILKRNRTGKLHAT